MQYFADEPSTPSDKIWSKLNLLFCTMIAIVVGVTVLYQAMPVDAEKANQDKEIGNLLAAIDVADMTNKRLEREKDALMRDPEYAGMVARDRLNLMRDGETILRVESKK